MTNFASTIQVMNATKNTRTSAPPQKGVEERIDKAYMEYVLNEGKRPPSVFRFCSDISISEDSFYKYYGSFTGLEKKIWKKFIEHTTSRLKADAGFGSFSAKEKLLTFYYALFEDLKRNRSFILKQLENQRKLDITPGFLKDFRAEYEEFVDSILKEGKASGEIAKRPVLEKSYSKFFWLHLGFLLIFWRDDDSAEFEKTDAAIEKSVNLAFELIGKGAFETVVDFAKFLYQTKVK